MGDQSEMLREISGVIKSHCGDDLEKNLSLTLAAVAHCAGFAGAAMTEARPNGAVTAEVLLQAIFRSDIISKGIARRAGVQ